MTITWPSLRRLEHCAAMEAIRLVALRFVRTIVLGDLHRNRPEVTGIRAVAVAGEHLPCLVPSGIGHVPRFHRVRHDGPTRPARGWYPHPGPRAASSLRRAARLDGTVTDVVGSCRPLPG